MVRKRAKGGGMKPRGDFAGLGPPVSIRMPTDMRAQLESAARRSGKSVTQELLRRLNDSFRRDREKRGHRDDASRALCYLLAELIELVNLNTVDNPKPSAWRESPFAFRTIKLAFARLLDALEPKGKIKAPEGLTFGPAIIAGSSPDKMAENAAAVILYWLQKPPGLDSAEGQVFPRKIEQLDFGMKDANRELLSKRERSQ